MLLFNRQRERRLATGRQTRIDVRTAIEQPLRHVQHAVLRRLVQRREIVGLCGVDVCAVIEQQLNDLPRAGWQWPNAAASRAWRCATAS